MEGEGGFSSSYMEMNVDRAAEPGITSSTSSRIPLVGRGKDT